MLDIPADVIRANGAGAMRRLLDSSRTPRYRPARADTLCRAGISVIFGP